MKTKTLISNASAAIIVALSFVGCQDYDNGFTEKEIAFQEAFRKDFGEIDPEQDWNLATRGTLHVDINKEANVKIFSGSPTSKTSVLMANYNVSSPSDLGFDMPEGTEQVYVQVLSNKKLVVSGYYDVIDGIVESVQTLDGESGELNVTKPSSDNSKEYYVHESGETWDNSIKIRNYTLYNIDKIPNSKDGSVPAPDPWSGEEMFEILDETTGVFGEGNHNWEYYVHSEILDKNVIYTIKEGGGEMSVTLEYYRTSTPDNQFAYFYWKDDDIQGKKYPSYDDFESGKIKLYRLIENVSDPNQGYVTVGAEALPDNMNVDKSGTFQGTTFQLVYFGKDGKGEPTLKFDEGTHIGFAICWKRKKSITDEDGVSIEVEANTEKKDVKGGYDSDHVWFSIQDMNVLSTNWGAGNLFKNGNFGTAATFKLGEKVILGFEDWPETLGSDLNDIMFWVEGDFVEKDEIPQLIPTTDKPQSWVLAYEDLGNSFDWDYNDVVLKVSHVAGQEYIEITPLAAGGTLASYVKLNGLPISRGKSVGEDGTLDNGTGEIHQLLGAEATASGNYAPINAYSRDEKQGIPIICDFRDYYDDDKSEGLGNAFSMTTLGTIKQMGGITLHVQNDDGSDGEETIEFSLDNIGKAPEVMCLPGSWTWTEEDGTEIVVYEREWRWPAEYKNINYAYDNEEANFAGWAANKNTNKDWYKKEPNEAYRVDGTFDKELYRGPSGNYNPNPDPSGPTFPSDAGTEITENIEQRDEYYHIPFDVISQYITCTITLQISNRNYLYGIYDNNKGNKWPNYIDKLSQNEEMEDIYTITLSLDEINKFTDGLWFDGNNGFAIVKAAIDGEEDNRKSLKTGDNIISSDKITKTEQTFINFAYAYDVDLSNYKLKSDFNGTASITIKFAENVTYVGVFTGYVDDWNSISSETIYYGDGKTEFELNITDTSKLSDMINNDGFNVRWNGGTSSNSILSINITLIEN